MENWMHTIMIQKNDTLIQKNTDRIQFMFAVIQIPRALHPIFDPKHDPKT